jgi:2,4-dienoyl-CoA reductase-like NADH-dependent reductase (Old Yellow Enzyme family)
MITGGFRSRAAMDEALAGGDVDVIGIARPMCVDTDAPNQLLASSDASTVAYEQQIKPSKGALGWFCLNIIKIAEGTGPNPDMTGEEAITAYLENEERTAASLKGMNVG